MARDYKNRIPAYRLRKRRSTRMWAAAGAAGCAGLVALGLYVFAGSKEETAAPPPADTVTVSTPPPHGAAGTADPKSGAGKTATAKDKIPPEGGTGRTPATPQQPEPRFTFYKILPEKEVIIPESEIKTMKREESLGKKPEAAYLLQAGSFTSQQEAEKLKARLAEIKVKAKLEMIKLENTAWYRVKVGPYATLADADKVRQYLRANKIDSIVQKAAK
jgi:cell division protein FtsN